MARKRATEAPAATTAAIYCRISSDPAGERAGVERQLAECEQLAAKLGLTVAQVYTDNDISAFSGAHRPAFELMLTDAAAGNFQVVITWASDRLYRRMVDLVRITSELAPFARIATVTGGDVDLSTGAGILNAQVLGSIGEYESRHKGERVAARAKQRAEAGVMTTARRPFGWTWAIPCPGGAECEHSTDCHGRRPRVGSRAGLVREPTEAPELAITYRNIANGASLRSETRRLTAAGFPVQALRSVLTNPRNAGLVSHRGQIVTEDSNGRKLKAGAKIVDRKLWDEVQLIVTDPERKTSSNRPANTILGGGLLLCGICGANMASGGKKQRAHPIYTCSRNRCVTRVRPWVDGPVLDLVGDVVGALAASGNLALPTITDDPTTALRAAIAADEGKTEALAKLMSDGELDPADFAKATKRIRKNIEINTTKLTRRANRPALAQLGTGDVADAWARRRASAETGDADWIRLALRELLDSITYGKDRVLHLNWKSWVGPAPDTIGEPRSTMPIAERRVQVAELVRTGVSIRQIGERLGVNRGSIVKDLAKLRAAGRLPAGPKAGRKVSS